MDCRIIVLALPSGFVIDSYGWHSCHIMAEFVLTNLSSAMEVPQASGVVIRAGEQPALLLEQLARIDGSCVPVVRFDFDLGNRGSLVMITNLLIGKIRRSFITSTSSSLHSILLA